MYYCPETGLLYTRNDDDRTDLVYIEGEALRIMGRMTASGRRVYWTDIQGGVDATIERGPASRR